MPAPVVFHWLVVARRIITVHPAMLDESVLLSECRVSTTRRSGPGGQHRNKVETAVVVTHLPTGLTAEASERRSQEANRRRAVFRLRLRLAVDHRTPAAALSDLWQSRVQGGRISVGAEHTDYPAVVAEAFNHLAACDFDIRTAAERLKVTSTQLVRLLQASPAAFVHLNKERVARGLRPLR